MLMPCGRDMHKLFGALSQARGWDGEIGGGRCKKRENTFFTCVIKVGLKVGR